MLEKHYLTYLHGEFILDMKQLFFFSLDLLLLFALWLISALEHIKFISCILFFPLMDYYDYYFFLWLNHHFSVLRITFFLIFRYTLKCIVHLFLSTFHLNHVHLSVF